MTSPPPYKLLPVSPEEAELRERLFTHPNSAMRRGVLKTEPGGVRLPQKYAALTDRIYHLPLRRDDVFLVSFPKCGTTWAQEMIWQILHPSSADDPANLKQLHLRSPSLHFSGWFVDVEEGRPGFEHSQNMRRPFKQWDYDSVKQVEDLPSPRLIKCHLPYDMLNPKLLQTCKSIYVCRNPRDCFISFYNHETKFPGNGFTGTFGEHEQTFRNGLTVFGSYWHHLKTAWELKDNPNLKIIWFEEMKANQEKVISDVADFLDVKLSPDQVAKIAANLEFSAMSKRSNVVPVFVKQTSEENKFLRKGQVGDWRNHFTADMTERWDRWIAENIAGTDIKLPEC